MHAKGTNRRHWLHLTAAAAGGDNCGFTRHRAGTPRQASGKERIISLGVDGKEWERADSPSALCRSLRWGWVNVEDDLRSRWSPLQVSAHPNPQLVDVGMFPVVRRDRQRVGDGQELGEGGKRVRSLPGTTEAITWLACQKLAAAAPWKLPGTELLLQLGRGWRRDVRRDPGTLL